MRRVGSPLPKYLLGVFLGMVAPLSGTAQEVKSPNLPTYPIEMTEGSCTPESYSFLGELIGEARVVALGEASHGTGTITEHKRCLITYLVEQRGFSVVAFEAAYTLTDNIDAYIQGDRDDLAPQLGSFAFYAYGTEEVYDFFAWARAYNLAHPAGERFHVVGVDAYAFQETADDVLDFIELADPTFLDAARSAYAGINPANDVSDIEGVRAVAERLTARRGVYLEKYSEVLVGRALHSAEALVQHFINVSDSSRWRDKFMSDNVQALLESHEKVVLWAHNGHVVEGEVPFTTAGAYLAESLGDDYFSVAITFGQGMNRRTVPARWVAEDCAEYGCTEEQKDSLENHSPLSRVDKVPLPRDGSLEAFLLERIGTNVFVDLRADENLPTPLRSTIPMRWIGTVYKPGAYQLTDLSAFDALIFLGTVSAATDLQAGNPFERNVNTNP